MKTKVLTLLVCCAILLFPLKALAQEFAYPFQNPALTEEERLDNALSLMTVDEMIFTIVGQGVPRLGIANPGSTEAIHGIVRGGPTTLPDMYALARGQAGRNGIMEPAYLHSTAFPQAYGIGETWDREMARVELEVGGASRDSTGFGALEEGLISS